jgi:hypothetical protein
LEREGNKREGSPRDCSGYHDQFSFKITILLQNVTLFSQRRELLSSFITTQQGAGARAPRESAPWSMTPLVEPQLPSATAKMFNFRDFDVLV